MNLIGRNVKETFAERYGEDVTYDNMCKKWANDLEANASGVYSGIVQNCANLTRRGFIVLRAERGYFNKANDYAHSHIMLLMPKSLSGLINEEMTQHGMTKTILTDCETELCILEKIKNTNNGNMLKEAGRIREYTVIGERPSLTGVDIASVQIGFPIERFQGLRSLDFICENYICVSLTHLEAHSMDRFGSLIAPLIRISQSS